MAETHRMLSPRRILVKDLNTCITCTLCGGYLIDATAIVDCSHTFCRACIVRHFESSRLCPSCGSLVHSKKPLSKLRTDPTIQSLVYKVIPSLYTKEVQRRADFYHSTGFRANSSCSDDSVLGDRTQDGEEWAASNIGDPSLYFSPDDSISLSVEYYTKEALESCETKPELKSDNVINNNNNEDSIKTEVKQNGDISSEIKNTDSDKTVTDNSDKCEVIKQDTDLDEVKSEVFVSGLGHKRYLQCPAAVRMSHLMKFLRMKFALSNEHRVDIIYAGEVLPPYLSLMDVAYTFKWDRDKPMRFFYLIYIPVLRQIITQPSTTIATPSATITNPTTIEQPPIPPLKIEIPNSNKSETKTENNSSPIDNKTPKKHKEIKIKEPVKPEVSEDNNNLKISPQSKPEKPEKSLNPDLKITQKSVKFVDNYKPHVEYKVKTNDSVQASTVDNCVYEYSEPDKDEIKAFAERRDREWALQKYQEVHVSKKRKKSKHSKNEFMHKKRKLHAEITSNEVLSNTDDSLKLKVKLSVANGHKHKHRSSSSTSLNNIANLEPLKTQDLTQKERLLQMRQVRHKQSSSTSEDKPKTQEPNIKMVISTEKSSKTLENNQNVEQKPPDIFSTGKTLRSDFSNKTSLSKDICNKYVRVSLEKFGDKNSPPKKNSPITISKSSDEIKPRSIEGKTEIIPIENKNDNKNNKIVDSGLSIKITDKNNGSKILDNKIITNKVLDNKLNKIPPKTNESKTENKTAEQKPKTVDSKLISKTNEKVPEKSVQNSKMAPKIEPKSPSPNQVQKPESKSQIDESKVIENKLNNLDFKTSQSSTYVTKNFTVSKVETGQKRKLDSPEGTSDKVPSLEITVINLVSRPGQISGTQTAPIQSKANSVTKSIVSTSSKSGSSEGPPVKKIRPPPLTIPLGRIQKMNNIKTNLMKSSEKCDIFGALDLSAKPTNKTEIKTNEFRALTSSPKTKLQDQIQSIIRPKTPIKSGQDLKISKPQKPNISNLQMLSESAVQIREQMTKGPIASIPNLIKKLPTSINPNLQKNPNFQPKTPNLIPKNSLPKNISNFVQKPPNFVSKNLQKLPKLNEISKGQFCRLNSGQIRPPRPAGQNQTVRNIPNPSLLVRQQNQNRINSLNETQKQDTIIKPKIETESEKRPENKTSEPPPLKPIESFKK